MKKVIKTGVACLALSIYISTAQGQVKPLQFGTERSLDEISGQSKGKAINWINVNTDPDTWKRKRTY
ncbi:hypothetical protein [Pedobacter frigoris]|uniref:hypothetical protein n=1 Tax=Pedobacter frigoris TaxID=2571272 RepID=UPI001CECC776|nr:hypothetical protein [Pedobacter frigoris]